MKRSLLILLVSLSVVLFGQSKQIEKSIRLLPHEFTTRGLIDLESDTICTCFRIWLEPDLVIDITDDQVELTLYITQLDKKNGGLIVTDLKKFQLELNPKQIFNYLNGMNLANWNDSRTPIEKSEKAMGVIQDGIKIFIEYSDKTKYRLFGLYSPIIDDENSHRTMELLNFLDESIDPDKYRRKYYQGLESTNKTAKQRLKSILDYRDYFKKEIERGVFPKMWGDF